MTASFLYLIEATEEYANLNRSVSDAAHRTACSNSRQNRAPCACFLLSLLKGIRALSNHDYFMPQIPHSILAYKFQTHTQTTEIFLLSRKHPAEKNLPL